MTDPHRFRAFARATGLAAAATLALLAAACQSPIETHGENIEKVFDQLRMLDAAVTSAPPLAEDRIDTGGARVVLEGDGANALFIVDVHLADPMKAGPYGTGAELAVPIQTCARALVGQTPFHTEEEIARHLQQCASAEYAFVLRSDHETYGELLSGNEYTPGAYAGEVRLYRLADGAALGGFRVSAANDDELTVAVGQYGEEAAVGNALVAQVRERVQAAIVAGLREHVPGSVP